MAKGEVVMGGGGVSYVGSKATQNNQSKHGQMYATVGCEIFSFLSSFRNSDNID